MICHAEKRTRELISTIEELICQDPGQRDFSSVLPQKDLFQAAEKTLSMHRILIVTGFCVLDSMTGETDGLTGSLVLASALSMLQKEVMLVTDQYSGFLLRAGMPHFSSSSEIRVISDLQFLADEEMIELLDEFKPEHIIAIERPGKAVDGNSYSMRGEKLNHVIPQLDLLFKGSSSTQPLTTAIGDGGNEMGMGNFYPLIMKHVALGDKIGCVTPADLVIPAGVSNWAGYGFAAALSLLTRSNLMPLPSTEKEALKAMVQSGAVDGCTKKREATVDGLPWDTYISVINQIIALVHQELKSSFP